MEKTISENHKRDEGLASFRVLAERVIGIIKLIVLATMSVLLILLIAYIASFFFGNIDLDTWTGYSCTSRHVAEVLGETHANRGGVG